MATSPGSMARRPTTGSSGTTGVEPSSSSSGSSLDPCVTRHANFSRAHREFVLDQCHRPQLLEQRPVRRDLAAGEILRPLEHQLVARAGQRHVQQSSRFRFGERVELDQEVIVGLGRCKLRRVLDPRDAPAAATGRRTRCSRASSPAASLRCFLSSPHTATTGHSRPFALCQVVSTIASSSSTRGSGCRSPSLSSTRAVSHARNVCTPAPWNPP